MNGLELITYTIAIIVAFFCSVFPIYYKVGKLEQKVNSLCNLVNRRRSKK